MFWRLHGLTIHGASNDAMVRERWQQSFASLRLADGQADLAFELNLVPTVPAPPAGEPQFRQGDLLQYTLDGRVWVAHFPRFGQLRLDLANGTTEGRIVAATLGAYGVFDDLLAIGLSPHLRRRGLFLIHAFGAVPTPTSGPAFIGGGEQGRGAVLLVGGIGSGKTTTGVSLLNAGWKLLSNDSPILTASSDVLSYPGLLAAYPDTFARFEATAHLARSAPDGGGRQKSSVAAERIWPEVWIERARAGVICFPQIESRTLHSAESIAAPDALRRLLPHAVEQWDREMIPEHLRVLRKLVESAPAYSLHLGPEVTAIPSLLADLVADQPAGQAE